MKIQNYLCDKLGFLFLDIFYVPISPTFCGQYILLEDLNRFNGANLTLDWDVDQHT